MADIWCRILNTSSSARAPCAHGRLRLPLLPAGLINKNLPCVTTPRGLQGDIPSATSSAQLSASVWTTQLKYSLSRRHGGCKTRSSLLCSLAWSGHAAGERTIPVGRDNAFRLENTCGRFFNETLARWIESMINGKTHEVWVRGVLWIWKGPVHDERCLHLGANVQEKRKSRLRRRQRARSTRRPFAPSA